MYKERVTDPLKSPITKPPYLLLVLLQLNKIHVFLRRHPHDVHHPFKNNFKFIIYINSVRILRRTQGASIMKQNL
jgi:hypothetical protein